jgi:hypothetical protein
MNLTVYYQNLPERSAPKSDFIRTVARKCNVGEPTVRMWVKGKTKPSNREHINILAQETGLDASDLF